MLRIAVNGLPLMAVHTGIARYLTMLYSIASIKSKAQVRFLTPGRFSKYPPAGASQGGPMDRMLSLKPRLVYWMRSAHWLAYEAYAGFSAGLGRFDLLHESFYTPASIGRKVPQVFTLHDLSLLKYPNTHSVDRRLFFNHFFKTRLDQPDAIIVPSQYVSNEVCELLDIGDRVVVIPEGVAESFRPMDHRAIDDVKATYGLPSEYGLFVGTLEPRKNLKTLLKGLSRAKTDIPLVVAGWSGWGDPAFQAELKKLGMDDRVVFPGYINDQHLAALYSGAKVFFYPSLYEGFGLPVLEAMACGTPVICSNAASIPEVGKNAVVYAAPDQPDQWAEALDKLLLDESAMKRCVDSGIEVAATFRWEDAAANTMKLFSEIVNKPSEY